MPKKAETVEVSDDNIRDLRSAFFQKLDREKNKIPGGFDQMDIDRITNRRNWLKLFLEYNDCNIKASLDQLWNTCIWRKEKELNDCHNERTVDMDLINAGLMFDRGVDVDGKKLLIFKTKMYTRGQFNVERMKKNLNYYVERLYRESDMDQITVFFDMEDSGMSNLDMDYTRYIINLFKLYYPNSCNYILVYELPWVLTAAFKIIKGLLPPKAVEALKFINKKNISEYITPENQLTCWGGKDDYKFVFTPQDPKVQILPRDPEEMGDGNNNESQITNRNQNGSIKKVHFAPNMSPIESPMSEHAPSQFKDDKRLKVLDEGIVFGPDAQEGNVTVENVSSETVMFKVKTTNPEKFRVSPPAGLIRPNQLERITVSLVHGGQRVEANSVRDKFLIMCKPLEEGLKNDAVPIDQIHKEFKQASSADIEQHRIRCIYPTNASPDGTFPMAQVEGDARAVFRNGSSTMRFSTMGDAPLGRSSNQISDLHETIQRLERKVSRVQTLQFVLLAIIFLLIAVVAVYLPRFEVASSLADLSQQAQEHTLPGKGI